METWHEPGYYWTQELPVLLLQKDWHNNYKASKEKGQFHISWNRRGQCDAHVWCRKFHGVSLHGKGKKIHALDALVLPKVTRDMPANPVDSISQWKHLTGLDLVDPEFGTPVHGSIDVHLGADCYGEILLHGRRWGP